MPGKTYQINQKLADDRKRRLDIELFFTLMAINLITGTISKCEFRTFAKGKEIKQDEYYLWNIEPNDNQNSSQFIQELILKLLFNNEALVVEVNGKLVVADSFERTPYAFYPDTFSGVSCGDFRFDKTFSAPDVLYFRMGHENIRAHLSRLMSGYSDLLDMAIGKYKRAGGRKGTAKINRPKSGDKQFEKQIEDLFTKKFRAYFEAENAVVDLPNGVEYSEITGEGSKKSTSEIADIQGICKEAVSRVAQAFRIPPSLLQGDIADIGSLTENYLTFCIDPLTDMIEEEITRKRYGKAAFLAGYYLMIDTTCIKHIDIFDVAEQADKLIADSIYNVDEIRRKVGDAPLNTWWSKQYVRTKNYESVTGGENGNGSKTDENNLGGEDGGGSA